MSSRNMSLLPRATLHSDSEQERLCMGSSEMFKQYPMDKNKAVQQSIKPINIIFL
jgi:hypothetical protein